MVAHTSVLLLHFLFSIVCAMRVFLFLYVVLLLLLAHEIGMRQANILDVDEAPAPSGENEVSVAPMNNSQCSE